MFYGEYVDTVVETSRMVWFDTHFCVVESKWDQQYDLAGDSSAIAILSFK